MLGSFNKKKQKSKVLFEYQDEPVEKNEFISIYRKKFTDRTRCANPQAKNIKVLEKTKKLLKKENLSTISVRKINKSYDNIMISAWNTEHND